MLDGEINAVSTIIAPKEVDMDDLIGKVAANVQVLNKIDEEAKKKKIKLKSHGFRLNKKTQNSQKSILTIQ